MPRDRRRGRETHEREDVVSEEDDGHGNRSTDTHPPEDLGRFDRSFFVRMVASFLVFTVAFAVLELGLRFGFMLYDFHVDDAEVASVAADRLEGDLRRIMLNRGGPVASRTVYPILERNFRTAGLHIAVEPSETTKESIEAGFHFEPKGIQANFPEGIHHEAVVPVRADEVCLQCHGTAEVGDVLGTIRVRDYLSTRIDEWWGEVRLTATLNLLNVVVHSVILFFLLRFLLDPLLTLRGTVARLAQGERLTTRARVDSRDEFGELAHDLNTFLDRIEDVLQDVRQQVAATVGIHGRLSEVSRSLRARTETVTEILHDVARDDERVALPVLVDEVHGLVRESREVSNLDDRLDDVALRGTRLLQRLRAQGEAGDGDRNGGEDGEDAEGSSVQDRWSGSS